jgi:hypothetical protein
MNAHEYKPGDKVIVFQNGKPARVSTVQAVKLYKIGPKVTLADNTDWDVKNCGHAWGTRGERWNNGPIILPWTEAGAAGLRAQIQRGALEFVLKNWSKLTDEQQEQIGEVARTIRKTVKS